MMAMEITNNYQMYAAQNMAQSSTADKLKKKDEQKAVETVTDNQTKSADAYVNELAKLAPSVECMVGTGCSSSKSGKTLTINPKLLEKMQTDPAVEKEMKELIKGVENVTNLIDSIYKASGWNVLYRHSYIDENGKYCAIACVRNDFMLDLSDKLREERRQNAEELIEETKEWSAEKTEDLQELLEEKITEEEEDLEKAEKLLHEKMEDSQDGILYLDDEEFRIMMEAARAKEKEDENRKGVDENFAPQKIWERNRTGGRAMADKGIIKQAADSLSAGNYGSELAEEVDRLNGQNQEGQSDSLLRRTEDAVRAYANLYDEIVQAYQNGTREHYVEEEDSESGFRKMTMEEELEGLERAFQKMADEADVKDMITGEFKRLSRKATEAYQKLQKEEETPKETMGQKMKKLAKLWKEAYQLSGSKEAGMEEVLSMLRNVYILE